MKSRNPVKYALCCCTFASAVGAHDLGAPDRFASDTTLQSQKKPQLLAGGPVMRPSSPNQPITNPSTGPRTYSSKSQTLPVLQPTELQEKTAPTKAAVPQEKTLQQEKETREKTERQRKAMSTDSEDSLHGKPSR